MSTTPPRRRLSPEERRAELLAATREELGAGPFATLTVPAITKRAGASQGTFYRYFRDVQEAFVALLDERVVPRLMDLSFELDLSRPSSDVEVEQELRRWFRGLAELIRDEGPLLRAVLACPPRGPGPAAERAKQLQEQMRVWGEGLMSSVNGRPPYRRVDPRMVSHAVVGMTIASIGQATDDPSFDPDAWAREMAAFETWGIAGRRTQEEAERG